MAGAGRTIGILYDGGDFAVVDKPAGLPVQPGEAVGADLAGELEMQWGAPVWLVHRLDRDTGGCIVVALTKAAAGRLSGELARKETRKYYRAVVRGVPAEREGVSREEIFVHGRPEEALTAYRVVASSPNGFSLLELVLDTGRMHQIRIHLAKIGHPIPGDDRHGDFLLNRSLKKEVKLKKLLLYAARLELASGAVAVAPPPPHFRTFCEQAGLPLE